MEWDVLTLTCYPEFQGEADVVFNVGWSVSATETVGEQTYTGYVSNNIDLELDPETPFTPYNELTKEQVIGWVKNALGQESVSLYEANVMQQIEKQKTPQSVNPSLPW